MNAINNLFRILPYSLVQSLEAISVLLKVTRHKTLKSFKYIFYLYTNYKLYYNEYYCFLFILIPYFSIVYAAMLQISGKFGRNQKVNMKYQVDIEVLKVTLRIPINIICIQLHLPHTVTQLSAFQVFYCLFRILLINHFIRRGKVQLYIDKLPGGVWCKVFKLKGIS